jgi:hypothetical protein
MGATVKEEPSMSTNSTYGGKTYGYGYDPDAPAYSTSGKKYACSHPSCPLDKCLKKEEEEKGEVAKWELARCEHGVNLDMVCEKCDVNME